MITTARSNTRYVNQYHQVIKKNLILGDNIWTQIMNILYKPCNHIWDSWCNGLHLWCELVPLWDVSICIRKISYMKNYVNVFQVLDELVGSIQCTWLIITVLIWTITLSLKDTRTDELNFLPSVMCKKLNLANNTDTHNCKGRACVWVLNSKQGFLSTLPNVSSYLVQKSANDIFQKHLFHPFCKLSIYQLVSIYFIFIFIKISDLLILFAKCTMNVELARLADWFKV